MFRRSLISTGLRRQPKFVSSVVGCLLLFLMLPLHAPGLTASIDQPRHILFLHSYHEQMTWVNNINRGLAQELDTDEDDLVFHIEHLDAKRFYNSQYFDGLARLYKYKYSDIDFSLILVADDQAFDFIQHYREEPFAGTPVVFCGVNDYRPQDVAAMKDMTGVVETLSARETVETALRLHPDTQEIFIINDYLRTGRAWEQMIKAQLIPLQDRVRFTYNKNHTVSELCEQIRRLDANTIILLGAYYTDREGHYFTYEKAGATLAQASLVPFYCLLDFNIREGAMGGKVISGYHQGKMMGMMSQRILAGKDADDIPVMEEGVNQYMFDYLQLKRFDIATKDLPEGSALLNRPDSIYAEHKVLIWTVIIFIIFLLAVIAALNVNIILRKRAEELLRESEEKFRSFADQTLVGIFVIQHDRLIYINNAASDMLGYPRVEMLAWKANEFYIHVLHPSDKPFAIDQSRKKQAGRLDLVPHYTWRAVTKDGRQKWAETFSKGIMFGGKTANLVYIRDISEQKATQQALQESEENLRITMDAIGDAVIATDAEGVITRLNPTAAALTGWPISEAQGHLLPEILHIIDEETRQPLENPVDLVLKNGVKAHLNVSVPVTILVGRDGKERRIADSCAPIHNPKGDLVGAVLVFHDVTEQHVLEEQLRQAQKMDSIGQLAGGVAHDFNNMLGGILGAADLLATGNPDATEIKEYVHIISEAAERAADLTNKLLTFSRKSEMRTTLMDVHVAITDATRLLERSIDKRIELHHYFHANYSNILGDPGQLQNAILNLGLNARDAMLNGGKITITTKNIDLGKTACQASSFDLKPGQYVEILLQDEGTGMDQETLKHIFEPFFTTKKVGQGTGLGLSAVYGTITQHHGSILVESEPGKGTLIEIALPVESVGNISEKSTASEISSGTGRIMIIDDEMLVRKMAQALLTDMGYDVIMARDGKEGLKLYQEQTGKIDLVILDMVMPKMNGREVFLALKEIDPQVKVILSSGYSRDQNIGELIDAGAVDFLQKPYRRADLSRMLSEVLG